MGDATTWSGAAPVAGLFSTQPLLWAGNVKGELGPSMALCQIDPLAFWNLEDEILWARLKAPDIQCWLTSISSQVARYFCMSLAS